MVTALVANSLGARGEGLPRALASRITTMDLLHQALRGAQSPAALAVPPLAQRANTLVVVGGGGTLGSAVLEQALVAGRFARVLALVDEPLVSTLRGLVPLPRARLEHADVPSLCVDSAIIVFERGRHSNGRDAAFTQPDPDQLTGLALELKRHGVGALTVVVPHAPALMPQSLAHGLASLDEAAVAALGFEHLVFVRAARPAAAPRAADALQRLAQWWLSQLRLMVPNQDQALRSATLASAVVQLAQLLPTAPAGTRVLAPHTLWPMVQDPARLADALAHWLHGRCQP